MNHLLRCSLLLFLRQQGATAEEEEGAYAQLVRPREVDEMSRVWLERVAEQQPLKSYHLRQLGSVPATQKVLSSSLQCASALLPEQIEEGLQAPTEIRPTYSLAMQTTSGLFAEVLVPQWKRMLQDASERHPVLRCEEVRQPRRQADQQGAEPTARRRKRKWN